MSLIQLHDLTIGYRGQMIVEQLNLSFKPQEVTCLLGANDCGKTTLLKTILGVLPKFLGYVPQAHNHVFPFTVEAVVLMSRTAHLDWYSSSKAQYKTIAHEYIQQLGIEHLVHKPYT